MARLAGKKIISQDEMSQEIDLKRYLKRDPTPNETRLFAEFAIEKINQRTLSGDTIHGGNFKKYTKEYADRKGVDINSVDLFLDGGMLDSLEANETSRGIKINIGGDSVETKKGYNHHVGDTLPKRPWFGLTTDEVREFAQNIPDQTQEEAVFTLADLRNLLSALGLEQSDTGL